MRDFLWGALRGPLGGDELIMWGTPGWCHCESKLGHFGFRGYRVEAQRRNLYRLGDLQCQLHKHDCTAQGFYTPKSEALALALWSLRGTQAKKECPKKTPCFRDPADPKVTPDTKIGRVVIFLLGFCTRTSFVKNLYGWNCVQDLVLKSIEVMNYLQSGNLGSNPPLIINTKTETKLWRVMLVLFLLYYYLASPPKEVQKTLPEFLFKT